MFKVPNSTGLFYALIGSSKKKTYFARFSVLENGVTKQVKKRLSTSLTVARKMLPLVKDGLTVQEALKKVTKIEISKTNSIMTVANLYALYLPTIQGVHSDQEVITKKSRFKTHILNYKAVNDSVAMASKDFKKLTYSYFQNFINHLDNQNTLGNIKCARKTQENIKASLQALYSFAQKENLYTQFNPLTHVEIKPYDNHKELLLTNKEILALYKTIKDMPVLDLEDRKKRLFFIFMIHARRKSEALKIKWTDINFLNKEYVITIGNSKSNKTQHLKMTDWLYQELLDLKSQIDVKDSETYVFLNPQTNSFYVDLSTQFKKIKAIANITSRFTIHEFRHIIGTVAVRQLDNKLHLVGEALTHASDETTKIYVNRTKESSKTVVDDVLHHLGFIEKETIKKDDLKGALQTLLSIIDKS